ncbi:MAG: hypothetical protein IJ737_01370 [Ruminococcus sp.]|nr:hypothetical protein [Ruminococcus sp.]MBR2282951.1 hypothetical protein [Ruminococcus sp.]
MKKPLSIRILMMTAALITGVLIVLDIYAVSNPELIVRLLGATDEVKSAPLPSLSRSLLMMRAGAVLPITFLSVFNAVSGKAGAFKAAAAVFLSEFFNILRIAADNYLYGRAIRSAAGEGAATIEKILLTNNAMTIIGHLAFIAIMLICCAAAVEMYIAGHGVPETAEELPETADNAEADDEMPDIPETKE